MSIRDIISPNPRLTQKEYELAMAMGRKRYAVRGGLRMARWLLGLSVVILAVRGSTTGDWRKMLTPHVAAEVGALIVLCSLFITYTTYALVWRALTRMFGGKPGSSDRASH